MFDSQKEHNYLLAMVNFAGFKNTNICSIERPTDYGGKNFNTFYSACQEKFFKFTNSTQFILFPKVEQMFHRTNVRLCGRSFSTFPPLFHRLTLDRFPLFHRVVHFLLTKSRKV